MDHLGAFRKTYRDMETEKLEQIARFESKGPNEEVVAILIEEISRRGLETITLGGESRETIQSLLRLHNSKSIDPLH